MNNFCYVYEKQVLSYIIVKTSTHIYKIMWKSKYAFLKKMNKNAYDNVKLKRIKVAYKIILILSKIYTYIVFI